MRPEIKARENRFEVRRTQLTGSTSSLASCGQANDFAPRQIIVVAVCHRDRVYRAIFSRLNRKEPAVLLQDCARRSLRRSPTRVVIPL
jgi:tRNA A37 threonylcarbamoyladenosine modification protein TsaB